MASILLKNQSEPSTPTTGRTEVWIDPTTKTIKSKDDTGAVTIYESTAYTSENVANKENVTVDNSTVKYPTVNLLKTHVDEKRKLMSAGTLTDITISNLGLGQIGLGTCEVALYNNETFTGNIEKYVVNSVSSHQLVPNQYTYITINYNSGIPQYEFILDNTTINHSNIVTALQVYWEYVGSLDTIHVFNPGEDGLGLTNKLAHQLIHTDRFAFESGLGLSEYGTRNVTITSGKVWYSGEEIVTLPVDSAINPLRFYYHISGNFNGELSTTYNNTYYDNGIDLVELTAGKYAVNWIYKCVNNITPCSYLLLGNGDYTLSEAQQAQQPTLPLIVAKQTILVGKIIVLKGDNIATDVSSAFTQIFAGSSPADHANLTHLDYVGSGHTGFQASLGFTPENVTNKENITVNTSTTKFPTINLLNTYVNTQRKLLACGPTTDITIIHLGSGNISVSTCVANFNTSSDFSGNIESLMVPAIASHALTANQYTYIVPDYNSGSPVYTFTTDNSIINHATKLNAVQVYWEVIGTINEIHIFNSGKYGLGLSNKLSHRLIHTERFGYESGLMLSESGTRNIELTSGTFWYDGNQIDTLSVNTLVNSFRQYFHLSSSWTALELNSYNNTQYDNGVNLQTLSNGRYAINWIYRIANGSDSTLFIVLGNGDYTLLQAQSSQPPVIPTVIQKQTIFVGRIIVQKNALTATQIDSAFSQTFSGTSIVDHANLVNLDYASSGHTGFQASLGFTPENTSNKENTTLDTSITKYPTNNLVKTYVDGFGQWTKVGNDISYSAGNVTVGVSKLTVGTMVFEEKKLASPFGVMLGIGNTGDFSSVNIGRSNVSGASSTCLMLGISNTTSIDGVTAIGRNNIMSGNSSIAIGSGITNNVANSLMIGPSNTAKVTILTSGNVGIGTTSPTSKLHSSDAITSGITGTAGNFQLARSSDGLVAGGMNSEGLGATRISAGGAGSYIAFQTAGVTNAARIINTGEIGIGTIIPTSTLHVSGSFATKLSTIVGTTTLDSTYCVVLCNSTSAFDVTLPLASSCPDRQYTIKNINTGVITVVGTIDGATNYSLPTQYKYVKVISNGTAWFIIGNN